MLGGDVHNGSPRHSVLKVTETLSPTIDREKEANGGNFQKGVLIKQRDITSSLKSDGDLMA